MVHPPEMSSRGYYTLNFSLILLKNIRGTPKKAGFLRHEFMGGTTKTMHFRLIFSSFNVCMRLQLVFKFINGDQDG